jgi:hypothetical protein
MAWAQDYFASITFLIYREVPPPCVRTDRCRSTDRLWHAGDRPERHDGVVKSARANQIEGRHILM